MGILDCWRTGGTATSTSLTRHSSRQIGIFAFQQLWIFISSTLVIRRPGLQEAHLERAGGFFDLGFGRNRTINIQFLTSSRRVLPHFFLYYFHHLLERGEGERSLWSCLDSNLTQISQIWHQGCQLCLLCGNTGCPVVVLLLNMKCVVIVAPYPWRYFGPLHLRQKEPLGK